MKLASYLSDNAISHDAFGRLIRTSQAAVSRYATGQRTPRPAIMARITLATGGAVTPNDFIASAPIPSGSPPPAGAGISGRAGDPPGVALPETASTLCKAAS